LNKLFHCGKHYFDKIVKELKNEFWKDTFMAFSEYIDTLPLNDNIAGSVPLFYNHKIIIGSKSLFTKTWFDAGVQYIADIYNVENKMFLSHEDFNTKYHLNANFLSFLSLVKSVKSFLNSLNIDENNLQVDPRPGIPPYMKYILRQKKGCKDIYNSLNSNNAIPTSQKKWSDKLNITFEAKDWKIFYSLPFNLTTDTKVQWFQVRILHRILGTNDLLYKMNMAGNSYCTFCRKESETIEHLFCRCHITKLFISNLISLLQSFPAYDETVLLFGFKDSRLLSENILLLHIRLFIYHCKIKSYPLL
jgi:hypothetical protein